MRKRALITGVTGQTGSYLADLLLDKGYEVFGLVRRTSSDGLGNASHLKGRVGFIRGDITDLPSLQAAIAEAKPHEFYHTAAQSHVGISFSEPVHTAMTTGIGTLNCLEAIRKSGLFIKFVQSSTSELFGGQYGEQMMTEETPFKPRSPYGCAKLYAHSMVVNYRESYNMFACNSISFNHESPRRGLNFVTRKITRAIADIKSGKIDKIGMGNLKAKRDWSHAKDVAYGQWLMLQQADPDDFIFASGETHSVEEFANIAFKHAGLGDYSKYIYVDPQFYRPAEVDILLGDSSKARNILGWQPQVSFEELVVDMVDADLQDVK